MEVGHLQEAAKQLIAAKREEDVHRAAAVILDDLTDADQCLFALHDDGSFVSGASVPTGLIEVLDEPRLTDETGMVRHAFKIGKSFVIDDLTDVRSASSPAEATRPETGFRSLLGVPVGNYGVLLAAARKPAAFSEEDLKAVEQLGSFVVAAIDHLNSKPETNDGDRLEKVATVLSHDAANSLSVANGYLELAREDADGDHLDRVEVALTRLEELIDDLVTLMRTGDRITAIEEVELRTVAERGWNASIEARKSDLSIVDSATIMADRSSLSQLLENLFRNAVEHGGPSVTVHVGVLDAVDGFYVEDTGEGIPEAERDDIFDYGYSATADQSGFGLSIVQWIADAHGWQVAVREGRLSGARFEITGVEFAE